MFLPLCLRLFRPPDWRCGVVVPVRLAVVDPLYLVLAGEMFAPAVLVFRHIIGGCAPSIGLVILVVMYVLVSVVGISIHGIHGWPIARILWSTSPVEPATSWWSSVVSAAPICVAYSIVWGPVVVAPVVVIVVVPIAVLFWFCAVPA